MNLIAVQEAKALSDLIWKEPDKWGEHLAKAQRLLEAALSSSPNDTLVLTCLGAVLSDMGRHSEARDHLKRAIALGATDSNTYFNLGVAMINSDRYDDAMRYFDKSRTMAALPDSWQSYFDAQAY